MSLAPSAPRVPPGVLSEAYGPVRGKRAGAAGNDPEGRRLGLLVDPGRGTATARALSGSVVVIAVIAVIVIRRGKVVAGVVVGTRPGDGRRRPGAGVVLLGA